MTGEAFSTTLGGAGLLYPSRDTQRWKLTRFCLVVMFIVYNFITKSAVMITQYDIIQYNFI